MISKFDKVKVRDVKILRGSSFRNFGGRPDKFNRDGGKRYFNIQLTPEIADAMAADGWKVKSLPPREDGDEPLIFMKVNISYRNRGPKIYMYMEGTHPAELNEDTVDLLDESEIIKADLVISAWAQDDNGPFTAYLTEARITVEDSGFASEYASMEEVPF